jgi:glycosyltransferase involved in cell wall biosynthesis
MEKESLVSIIVPIFNSEKFLDKCIESILAQTYKKFELILIDDGSIDKSIEICIKYTNKDDRVKILREVNSGPSVSRNIGIDNAKGSLITFIDSDDYIESTMLEKMVRGLSESCDLVMCGYAAIYLNKNINRQPFSRKIPLDYLLDEFSDLYEKLLIQYVWNKMYKMDIIKNNNIRFDTKTSRGEDMLFNLEYLQKCKYINFIEDILYNYIRYNQQSLTLKYNPQLFEDQQRVFNKIRLILSKYEKYEVNKEKLENIYIERIRVCIRNIFNRNESISKSFLKLEITSIVNNKQVKESLKYYIATSLRKKVFLKALNFRYINVIYYLFKLNIIK